MEPNTLKRKRAKKDVSSEADADRRRGRPKVEKSDESAADVGDVFSAVSPGSGSAARVGKAIADHP